MAVLQATLRLAVYSLGFHNPGGKKCVGYWPQVLTWEKQTKLPPKPESKGSFRGGGHIWKAEKNSGSGPQRLASSNGNWSLIPAAGSQSSNCLRTVWHASDEQWLCQLEFMQSHPETVSRRITVLSSSSCPALLPLPFSSLPWLCVPCQPFLEFPHHTWLLFILSPSPSEKIQIKIIHR